MKRVWLLFGLSMLGEGQLLTLNDAVALALKENRGVQISALDAAKASEVVAEQKTARLPQLSAHILGGESLTPIDFNIPKECSAFIPPSVRFPPRTQASAPRKVSTA